MLLFSLWLPLFAVAGSLDSLETEMQPKLTSSNLDEKLNAYFTLGEEAYKQNNLPKALEYFLLGEKMAKQTGDDQLLAKIQYKIGSSYSKQHEYDKAIEVLTVLIKAINSKGGKPLGDASYRLAKSYQAKGNNELAFEYHFKALQIREELKDQKGIAYSHYQIGSIHFYQGNYHKAIEYYEQSLKIGQDIDHKQLQIISYGAIGAAYSRMKQVDLSLEYNLKAYEITVASNQYGSLSYITFNLGDNYQYKGDYDKALEYFKQSHEVNIKYNDQWGQISSTKAIGEIYITKGNVAEGLRYLRKSLALARKLQARPILVDVYKSLANNLESIGENSEANVFYRNFIALQDSLRSEATLEKMSDTKMKYEIEQRERDIQKTNIQLQNMYRNFLIVGLLALMVILWQLHTKYKAQTEHNKLQREKNDKIQQQNGELEQAHHKQLEMNQLLKDQNEQMILQNQKLERKNDELQRFAYIASHDLKEPLRNIGSFATLLKRRFRGQLGNDADDYIDFITTNVSRMYDLLHEVLMYSKLENEEIIYEWVALNEIVDTVKETLKGKIMEGGVDVRIADLPAVKGHRSHLLQLFQNLVSNSIKYNKNENPLVEVGIKENFAGHDLVYFVKDNGIGLDMEFKERVFEIFKRLHGKDEFEGTGVGLAICKKIVTSNNGDIWVESEVGKGATFFFTLKVDTKMPDQITEEDALEMQG
ncbi:MAG: tetratricopeptide repeat protein, partial [Bacteroidota bacterium]